MTRRYSNVANLDADKVGQWNGMTVRYEPSRGIDMFKELGPAADLPTHRQSLSQRADLELSQAGGQGKPVTLSVTERDEAGSRPLVFACGPAGLVQTTRAAAFERSFTFHSETFEL